MRTLRFFAVFAALMTANAWVSASETSDNFTQWMPNFAASDLNQRRDAQQNWQNFCRQKGNNSDVQKEIIRVSQEQLGKDNPVETTIWIIRQLGVVGDATAVPMVARFLTNGEVTIRYEAARTLATIPGPEAENALKNNSAILSAQLAKDALTSRAVKAAIPRNDGVETQMPMAIPYVPAGSASLNALTTLLQRYPNLNNMEKAQVLSNLTTRALRQQITRVPRPIVEGTVRSNGQRPTGVGQATTRGNATYMPLALEAAQSTDETLRNAGILAVGAMGGPEQIPFLLEQARTGGNRDLAKVALSRMSRQGIDAILLENLKAETDADKFEILADVLNRRYNQEIRPALLERAQAAGTPNRFRLLELAEPAATKANIADFVKVWALIEDRGQKDRTEQIIARLVGGDSAVVIQAMENWDTPEGLSLLGRIGDTGGLDKIRQSQNAIYAFRNWPNAVVANDLIAIARDDARSQNDRTSSLRAFIRVISLPNDQIGIRINDVQKVNRLAEAYELAARVDEKRFIIERVGQIRTVESLRFVLKHIDDAELRDRACASVLDLAHQTGLRRSARAEFNAALDKVLEVTTNDGFRTRAEGYKAAE